MDTVIGKAGKGPVLLVLTERKTREEIIRKMADKTMASVVQELDRLEFRYGHKFSEVFKTITIDNGSEFFDDKGMEKSILGGKRTTVYYCHPYSASERGSNENANKLIRRFIKKGEDIAQFSEEYIQYVQDWINNLPRKILDYYTPHEVMIRELGIAA
jgi:IS30 family transposase